MFWFVHQLTMGQYIFVFPSQSGVREDSQLRNLFSPRDIRSLLSVRNNAWVSVHHRKVLYLLLCLQERVNVSLGNVCLAYASTWLQLALFSPPKARWYLHFQAQKYFLEQYTRVYPFCRQNQPLSSFLISSPLLAQTIFPPVLQSIYFFVEK